MSESVSVVCVTHDRPDLLRQCLQSCVRQDYANKQVIVVINPNDAAAEAVVEEITPAAQVLSTQRNIGFFPALNLALAAAETDYVMIIDDDARFLSSNALSMLVDEFRLEPSLGAVTCSLEGPKEKPIDGQDRYVRAFTTGFTMFPRKVVTEWVGYVPDLFFRSAGETFWCTQLWEQCRPVKRLANVRMFHELSMKGRSTRDWYFHALRSQLLCAVMREPWLWLVPVLLSKFAKSFWQFLRSGKLTLWTQAWSSFLFHIGEALRLRKPISNRTRRLLHRLDRDKVYELSDLPEWKELTRADRTSLGVEKQVT
jgi:GT2 family glycosyltransferase